MESKRIDEKRQQLIDYAKQKCIEVRSSVQLVSPQQYIIHIYADEYILLYPADCDDKEKQLVIMASYIVYMEYLIEKRSRIKHFNNKIFQWYFNLKNRNKVLDLLNKFHILEDEKMKYVDSILNSVYPYNSNCFFPVNAIFKVLFKIVERFFAPFLWSYPFFICCIMASEIELVDKSISVSSIFDNMTFTSIQNIFSLAMSLSVCLSIISVFIYLTIQIFKTYISQDSNLEICIETLTDTVTKV